MGHHAPASRPWTNRLVQTSTLSILYTSLHQSHLYDCWYIHSQSLVYIYVITSTEKVALLGDGSNPA
jgi:hypothetical protein